MNELVLKVHPSDNVIVALRDLAAGQVIQFEGESYELPYSVSAKHKFVTEDLAEGDAVIMYGVLVGKAMQPIKRAEPITTFNLKHSADTYSLEKRVPSTDWLVPDVSKWANRTFNGYHRADGFVGTANYWLVVPLVFCENRNILKLKDAFEKGLGYGIPDTYQNIVSDLASLYQTGETEKIDSYESSSKDVYIPRKNRLFPNVDGIKFLTHESGCGEADEDSERLTDLFAAYANNPNVAGITVLSLGCQKTQFEKLQQQIYAKNPKFDKPLLIFEQQQYGTEYQMLSAAIKETFKGLIEINQIERQPAPIKHITLGLKCGGSDGFSGISANPVLGYLSDMMVALGAKTLLAEFPELCGVEQELIDRSVSYEVAEKFARLQSNYARQAQLVGAGFDMNPSAGNIKDGLITDAIKSAGAAKKGGYSPVTDVLDYAEISTIPGLTLVCTPGNDLLATTGQAASGANIILFTTGLGTPTGNPICPVVKISTNTKLAERMPDIIDFDCGEIINGTKTIPQIAEDLLEYIIGLANGEYATKAQLLGQDDFMPWVRSVNL